MEKHPDLCKCMTKTTQRRVWEQHIDTGEIKTRGISLKVHVLKAHKEAGKLGAVMWHIFLQVGWRRCDITGWWMGAFDSSVESVYISKISCWWPYLEATAGLLLVESQRDFFFLSLSVDASILSGLLVGASFRVRLWLETSSLYNTGIVNLT